MPRLTSKQLQAILAQQSAGTDPRDLRIPAPDKRKRDNREHRIQAAIVKWWRQAAAGFWLDPRLLFAIPNGALYGHGMERVIRAKMLKAEGLTNGAPDLLLCVGRYEAGLNHPPPRLNALFLEVKTPGGTVKPEQAKMHELLKEQGYCVAIVRSVDEGIAAITNYLR